MYESFYGLKDKPFSMLPDPGFLYLSKKHQAALTLLEYALYNNAGFCVISGDIGAGKTTLLRKLLENMESNVTVGMITNTHQSFGELLDWVLAAFDIHKPGLNKVEMHQVFVDFLLQQYAQDKTVLLIVDEAQNMDVETLEELRMLSNINSEKDQLLQVILAGQPELKQTMRQPALKQFIQRIAVDYHLGPLNLEETFGYIQHRLITAGAKRNVFTPLACQRIYDYSGGIPRLINLLCDTAMVYGFADQVKLIGENLVDDMVRERMADSLVPIIRSVPAATEREFAAPKKAKKNISAEPDAGRPVAKKAALSPHLKQVSSEQKKQASTPPAEKKTAPETRRPVAVKTAASAQAASLKADEASAEPVEMELPQADPAVSDTQPELDAEVKTQQAEEQTAEKKVAAAAQINPEALKPAFDFEAALLTEAEAAAEAQASGVDAAAHKPGPAPQHVENHVEVLRPPAVKESKLLDRWTLLALAVLVLVVLYLVAPGFNFESRDLVETEPVQLSAPQPEPDQVSAPQPGPAAVTRPESELSDDVKLRLEQAEKLKLELEQMKRDEQTRLEQLEAESRRLQEQRDEALLKAEKEKQARLKKAEEVKRAAARARALEAEREKLRIEMEARRAAEQEQAEIQQRAEIEAARKAGIEQEMKRAIEQEAQRTRELELEWRNAQRQALPAEPVSKPETSWKQPDSTSGAAEAKPETSKAAPEFVLDPCQGPSAKFLSTCRK